MLKTIFKVALAAGILYWLIAQGKLDFKLVLETFKNPQYLIGASFLIALQLFIAAYRFSFLIRIKTDKVTNSAFFSMHWISQLFSTILPGAFTSDLIKIGYINRTDPQVSKAYVLFSIFIDRIIGLNSLLFVAGATSLIFYNELIELHPMMSKIIFVNISLFVISLFGLNLMFLSEKNQIKLLTIIPSKKLKELAIEIWKLRNNFRSFLWAYIASIVGHLLAIVAFYIVNIPFFEQPIKLKYLATLIPLGQLAVVIPISPGGIGVGHAAFASLFNFIHHSNGASLYNVYWIMLLIVSLFGIFPFILNKQER